MKINIQGLNKAEILAALYNNAQLTATTWITSEESPQMTVEDAQGLLEGETYFDYVNGRPLKLDLSGDIIDSWGFDRDNGGEGTAERIISTLR